MTATVEQANWSPLQDLAPGTTSTARIGDATVPWAYTDVEGEYHTLRTVAGKMDLSAAGLVEATGDGAYDLVQHALARDLEFVTPEQSLISVLLDGAGVPLDVVNAYHVEDGFRLETSVGRGPSTLAHLARLRDELGLDAELTLRDDLTVILVEGPAAAKALEETVEPDLGSLPLSGLMEVSFAGTELLVSRTGFTGEYGYKLIVPAAAAAAVWQALGSISPVGHGALEIAMFEVRQPLLHRELAPGLTALEAGMGWLVDITKEDFLGRGAVEDAFEAGVRCSVIGFVLPGTTQDVAPGTPLEIEGAEAGVVLHSVLSPGRGDVIGLARVRTDLVAPTIGVEVGGAAGVTVSAPYLIPLSWKTR